MQNELDLQVVSGVSLSAELFFMGGAQLSLSVVRLEDNSFRLLGSSVMGSGFDVGISGNIIIPQDTTFGDMLGSSTVISGGFVIEGSLSVPGDATHAELLSDLYENGVPEGSFRTVGIGPDFGVMIGHGRTIDFGGWVADILESFAFFQRIISPLVIDLDGDGVELISLEESNAFFDLNLDGFAELTGWVSADDALLALDVDGDGIIDDNSELFGDQTGHANGFLALAAHDGNADGVIDANDAVFADLIVWRDLNGDGFSAATEMFSLSDVGITSIDLAYVDVNETNDRYWCVSSPDTPRQATEITGKFGDIRNWGTETTVNGGGDGSGSEPSPPS